MLRLHSDDRGATAIVVAISVTLLLGFAALVVDYGLVTNERRQDQSSADFSALASVQFSNFDTPPGALPAAHPCKTLTAEDFAICMGAEEVIQVVNENLVDPPTLAEWAGCLDTGHLALVAPQSECISFNETTQHGRVVIPDIDVETTFGQVLNRDVIYVSALAEAFGHTKNSGKLIPFALPGNAASTTYNCLKTGPNPDWGVCKDLPSQGNFGSLDVPVYGDPDMGTLAAADGCNPDSGSILSNIIRGIDHEIGTHTTGAPTSLNPALNDDNGPDTLDRVHVCPVFDSRANEVETRTGVGSELDEGLTFGYGPGERGRLWQDGGLQVRSAGGGNPATYLDDTPLWDHLLPGACAPTPSDTAEMQACLDGWGGGVIFDADIKDEARYAFVPQFWSPTFTSMGDYLIKRLRPVWLQTTYYSCSSGGGGGSAGECDIIHTPGVSGPASCSPVPAAAVPGTEPPDGTCGLGGSGNKSLEALTAFILDPLMLPESARSAFGTNGVTIEFSLIK